MKPVLLVECLTEILGGQRVALQIADVLKTEMPVVLACPGPGALSDAAESAGIEVRHCAALGVGSPLKVLAGAREVGKLLADVDPSLVYINGMTGLPAVYLANRRRNTPLVMHLHHLVKSPLHRGLLRFVHKRIQNSKAGGASVSCSATVAEFCGWPMDQVTVIHNGVDVDRFCMPAASPAALTRTDLGSNNERFLICFTGNIGGIKPHRLVIQAARIAAQSLPQVQFVFAGQTMESGKQIVEEAKEVAEAVGIPDLFLWLGWRKDLEQIYPVCDLTILGHEEGFPLSGLESVACGTALALPDSGGGNELGELLGIKERYSAGDAQSLALRIMDCARHHSGKPAIDLAKIVESRFSTASFRQRILQLATCTTAR